ncbi:MAG: archease [Armatimonadota bacterium]
MHTSSGGHEAVEHTADLAVRAWAPDQAGLIEQIAQGMLDLMLDERPPADASVEIVGEGRDDEDLLVDCLREILALWTVDRRVPVSVTVANFEDGRAVCEVGVVDRPGAGEAVAEEIKAVTYHGVEIVHTTAGLEVTVVFDI